MSKLEESILVKLANEFKIPIIEQPEFLIQPLWSKRLYKADFLLDNKLYVEVKGIMTLESMTKLYWLSNQKIPFFIFQGTEKDWHVTFNEQIEELKTFNEEANLLEWNIKSLGRLNHFITKKFSLFQQYTGKTFREAFIPQ